MKKNFITFLIVNVTCCFAQQSNIQNQLNQAHNYIINGDYTSAYSRYKKIIVQHPHDIDLLCNAGFVAKRAGYWNEAQHYYEHVLKVKKNHARAHRALSHIYLAQGSFEQGWKAYEYRWVNPPYYNTIFKNFVTSKKSFFGKKVLLKTEYGLGDTLQFIRYAHVLKKLGAYVIVESQKPLVKLLQLCPYIDEVIPAGSTLPKTDLQALLMSMPLIFDTILETIPEHTPYLYADNQLVEQWYEKIKHDTNFKIGICWQADVHKNSNNTQVQKDSLAKSIPLNLLAQLSQLKNVTLYSLQKINGLEQLQTLPKGLYVTTFDDFDESHGPFMDTAALITNLDLVITVDTSIAHLTGGLGIPTWILLPYQADWRWLIERNDSPWYPTVQLFRQPKIGDWQYVITKIKNKLERIS